MGCSPVLLALAPPHGRLKPKLRFLCLCGMFTRVSSRLRLLCGLMMLPAVPSAPSRGSLSCTPSSPCHSWVSPCHPWVGGATHCGRTPLAHNQPPLWVGDGDPHWPGKSRWWVALPRKATMGRAFASDGASTPTCAC